jgi:glutamine synthetase
MIFVLECIEAPEGSICKAYEQDVKNMPVFQGRYSDGFVLTNARVNCYHMQGQRRSYQGVGMPFLEPSRNAGKEEFMKKNYTREDVIAQVREKDVEFIRLQFTDMFGHLKNMAITSSQLEKALDNQFMFDGCSIDGFAKNEEPDMYLHPDFNTFSIFPWRPQQGKVARLICDVYGTDGNPYEGDPRYILKKVIGHAAEMGYSLQVGPECEFFLFHTDEDGLPTTITHEKAGYLDLGPLDLGENARRDMVLTLEEMGFVVQASHHEQAPAQHEIDFKYDEALITADNIMTFKMAVKTIAKRHGLHATFMPKPKFGENGSGMHINMALFSDGKNIFEDVNDPLGLSQEAYYFIGGIMKHIKGITAITNPIVNSYKRLLPGYEAPVYVAWSTGSRSPLLRIPADRGEDTRVELRSPDSSANPYLALAVCLEAGLDGIRNKIMPPKNMEKNLTKLSAQECREQGIELLPRTLLEAIEEMEKDGLVRQVLGDTLYDNYVSAKMAEWDTFKCQVTQWELDQYLLRF